MLSVAFMNEGDYRVLRALGHGREVSRTEAVRSSGEPHSVLTDLSKRKAKWFEIADERFRLSEKGKAALAYESRERVPALHEDVLVAELKERTRIRPAVKRELDQVHASLRSIARRARLLVERGETQRGLVFLGDDDLSALAMSLLLDAAGNERNVHVLEIDPDIAAFYASHGRVEVVLHDLRDPLPEGLHERFGAVYSDPPYAPEGFSLFANRAAFLTKPDGRYYVHYGYSRRARERGLAKQRILSERGWLMEDVLPAFTEYEGAESIGSRSTLVVAAKTPQTVELPFEGDELYTRREPFE